jgi:hypothetical protein
MKTIKILKDWQVQAIQVCRPGRNSVLQAPGGAGKSLIQVMLAQADIEDTANKQLIAVPKNHIHHGFFDADAIEFKLPGASKPSRWQVNSNFCNLSDGKTRRLKEFLLADVNDLRKTNSLAAICTHKALVETWARMSKSEKLHGLKNISFRIDEAHHVSNVFHEDDLVLFNCKDKQSIRQTATKLGNCVNYILRASDDTVKVHLATATYFRGDQQTILSERFKADFTHYYLPWDEHFETLGIEHLGVDFLSYNECPMDNIIELVKAESDEHHLIIIPALTHRWRTGKSLNELMKRLTECMPAGRVLDLVTPSTQEMHKQLLIENPEQFNAVVACRLFDEGTDWVPCSRMHNTDACEQSLTLAVQRFYRPLRQHPNKKVVQIFNYLPDFSPEMDHEERRKALSNRLNAFLACIVTQGELSPILVKVKSETVEGRKSRISLQEIFGDQYPAIMESLLKRYECIEDKSDAASIEAIVERVIADTDIPDEIDKEELKAALLQQVCRIASPRNNLTPKQLEPKGIDAESIRKLGFDKVWKKCSPVASVLCFGTESIDVGTIRELLGVLNEIPTLVEIHEGLRAFAKRTGKRPTFHQSEWIDELNRSASAVDKVLRRHFESTLAQEVRVALGDFNDDLIQKTHGLILDYWSRGIRIGNKFGNLPEIGMTSYALNGRLNWNCNTTLAAEVERVLGPHVTPMTLPKVKEVIRRYDLKGIRLHRKFGQIPELEMSSYNLADRLERNFKMKLCDLVDEVQRESAMSRS